MFRSGHCRTYHYCIWNSSWDLELHYRTYFCVYNSHSTCNFRWISASCCRPVLDDMGERSKLLCCICNCCGARTNSWDTASIAIKFVQFILLMYICLNFWVALCFTGMLCPMVDIKKNDRCYWKHWINRLVFCRNEIYSSKNMRNTKARTYLLCIRAFGGSSNTWKYIFVDLSWSLRENTKIATSRRRNQGFCIQK